MTAAAFARRGFVLVYAESSSSSSREQDEKQVLKEAATALRELSLTHYLQSRMFAFKTVFRVLNIALPCNATRAMRKVYRSTDHTVSAPFVRQQGEDCIDTGETFGRRPRKSCLGDLAERRQQNRCVLCLNC